jgi:hypothetical protein
METLGQKRVVLNYGIPTQEQKDLAQEIKLKCAELIDLIEPLKTNGERARVVALAQTEFETACMYSVKAVSNTYESTTI